MTARKSTALADRLAGLGISIEQLAEIIERPVSELVPLVEGKAEPDPEMQVRLRFLADDADALRRVEFLRRSYTRNLLSDAQRREQASNTTTLESVDDGRHYAALAGNPS